LCHSLGDLEVMYTVHLWLAGKRVVDFLLVLIELFHQLSRLRRYEWILVENVVFERGVGHFEHKFQGKESRPPTTPGLSRGVACVILRLAVFDTIPACDRATHRQTHDDS